MADDSTGEAEPPPVVRPARGRRRGGGARRLPFSQPSRHRCGGLPRSPPKRSGRAIAARSVGRLSPVAGECAPPRLRSSRGLAALRLIHTRMEGRTDFSERRGGVVRRSSSMRVRIGAIRGRDGPSGGRGSGVRAAFGGTRGDSGVAGVAVRRRREPALHCIRSAFSGTLSSRYDRMEGRSRSNRVGSRSPGGP